MLKLAEVAPDQLLGLPEPYCGYGAQRRRELVAGRLSAGKCLAGLGRKVPDFIGRRADGTPAWPPGIVGSISHSKEFAFAIVALADECRAVGIDVQKITTPLRTERICRRVLTPEEIEIFPHVTREIFAQVFSAKESIFKCLYPLVGKKFYFQDAVIKEFGNDGSFTFQLRRQLSEEFCAGWEGSGAFDWLDDEQVVTLVQLETF